MPRKVSRIRLADDQLEQMDAIALANVMYGHAWGFGDWPDIGKYHDAWRLWGGQLLDNYPRAYPASRPVIQYMLGLIEPPPMAKKLHPHQLEFRQLPGMESVIKNTAWHMQQAEADWLLKAGIIDDAEYSAGIERLSDPEGSSVHRYHETAGY